jgi:hypothetical protein
MRYEDEGHIQISWERQEQLLDGFQTARGSPHPYDRESGNLFFGNGDARSGVR